MQGPVGPLERENTKGGCDTYIHNDLKHICTLDTLDRSSLKGVTPPPWLAVHWSSCRLAAGCRLLAPRGRHGSTGILLGLGTTAAPNDRHHGPFSGEGPNQSRPRLVQHEGEDPKDGGPIQLR